MTPAVGGGMTPETGSAGWRVRHAVAAFSAGVLASLVASLAVLRGGISVFESFAVVGGAQTVVTIASVAWLRRAPGREPLGVRPLPADGVFVFLGAALAVAVSWATYAVVQVLFGGEAPSQGVVVVADRAEGLPAQVAVVVVTVLLAPLAEELVFRGVLLRSLDRRYGPRVGRYGSAAAFALTHVLLDFDAAVAAPALFVMGLVLAVLVQRRNRLGPAVIAHVGFNLVGVVSLLVS